MDHIKPWKSYSEQLELLRSRGLIVTDTDKAINHLERIGYYRLHGYWFPFRIRDKDQPPQDKFKPGATFQNAVDLYIFDKKLRLLVLDALETIEIAIRVDTVHTLGEIDPLAYRKRDIFAEGFTKKPKHNPKQDERSDNHDNRIKRSKYAEWLDDHNKLICRSDDELIRHNRKKYGAKQLPIWMVCEVWDFGCLSKLFGGMKQEQQNAIAQKYGVNKGYVFASWLHSLNYLRNVCAHHSRLWNRSIRVRPRKAPKQDELDWYEPFRNDDALADRPFLLLCIVMHIRKRIGSTSTWHQRLKKTFDGFPDLTHIGLDLKGTGAPDGWRTWPLWQDNNVEP